MAYFEITGLPLRAPDGEFGATVSLELERYRGLTVLSDDGVFPGALADAITGQREFSGEIILNGMRIDPMPLKSRPVKVLGDTRGIIPGRTVRKNLELALVNRTLSVGEDVFLVDEELSTGILAGLSDMRADSLDSVARTILAVVRILLAGCDLLIIRRLPVPGARKPGEEQNWEPGLQLDALIELKNLLRKHRATWISLLTDPVCVQVLSDRVAIFSQGTLIQEGSLRECFNIPASRLVADFLAFPRMNYRMVNIKRDGPFIMLESGRYGFITGEYAKRRLAGREGQEVIIGVRPEDLGIRAYETGDPTVMNLAKVTRTSAVPGALMVSLDIEDDEWLALTEPGRSLFTGQLVELRPDPDKIHIFHPESGDSLLD